MMTQKEFRGLSEAEQKKLFERDWKDMARDAEKIRDQMRENAKFLE